uniref:Uncharacterized protein n=1 Tax=Capra hircus TaxID=9925 RepID=A0A8C2Y0W7_CAPHI
GVGCGPPSPGGVGGKLQLARFSSCASRLNGLGGGLLRPGNKTYALNSQVTEPLLGPFQIAIRACFLGFVFGCGVLLSFSQSSWNHFGWSHLMLPPRPV